MRIALTLRIGRIASGGILHMRDTRKQSAGAMQSDVSSSGRQHEGLVLTSLILAAAVANLNLAVANVALPTIGAAFDASQTALDLVAVGYSLGLAASV